MATVTIKSDGLDNLREVREIERKLGNLFKALKSAANQIPPDASLDRLNKARYTNLQTTMMLYQRYIEQTIQRQTNPYLHMNLPQYADYRLHKAKSDNQGMKNALNMVLDILPLPQIKKLKAEWGVPHDIANSLTAKTLADVIVEKLNQRAEVISNKDITAYQQFEKVRGKLNTYQSLMGLYGPDSHKIHDNFIETFDIIRKLKFQNTSDLMYGPEHRVNLQNLATQAAEIVQDNPVRYGAYSQGDSFLETINNFKGLGIDKHLQELNDRLKKNIDVSDLIIRNAAPYVNKYHDSLGLHSNIPPYLRNRQNEKGIPNYGIESDPEYLKQQMELMKEVAPLAQETSDQVRFGFVNAFAEAGASVRSMVADDVMPSIQEWRFNWEDHNDYMREASGDSFGFISQAADTTFGGDLTGSLMDYTKFSLDAFKQTEASAGDVFDAKAGYADAAYNSMGLGSQGLLNTATGHYNAMAGEYSGALGLMGGTNDLWLAATGQTYGDMFNTGGIIPTYFQTTQGQYSTSLEGMLGLTNLWMNDLNSALGDSLSAIFAGEFDKIDDIWKGFLDSLLQDLMNWGMGQLQGLLSNVMGGMAKNIFGAANVYLPSTYGEGMMLSKQHSVACKPNTANKLVNQTTYTYLPSIATQLHCTRLYQQKKQTSLLFLQ